MADILLPDDRVRGEEGEGEEEGGELSAGRSGRGSWEVASNGSITG